MIQRYKDEWWYPVLIDAAYFERLRKDYPDKADWSDKELREHFDGEGWKYSDTWDHLGDARQEYEELADAFLQLEADHLAELQAEREKRGRCAKHIHEPGPSLYHDCCEVERLRGLIRDGNAAALAAERAAYEKGVKACIARLQMSDFYEPRAVEALEALLAPASEDDHNGPD